MLELNKFDITEANDFWKQSASNDVFYLKELSYKEKKSFLTYAIDSKGLKNSNVIINISLLIKQFSNIDETIFERKDIYFNSLMELIDLKIDMKQQLDDLREKLVKYYFGIVKSIIVKNEEQSIHLDNLYFHLMHILSINDISLMMQKISEVEDIPFICNAKEIYKNIINNSIML